MEHKELEAFITLAERLNFRQTSEIHNMTPSTLSRVIQRLEEEVGCGLFVRDNTGVTITSNGEKFYEFAKDSVEKYRTLQNSLHSNDPKFLKGNISIATTVTFAYTFLVPVVKKFMEKYPNVSVEIVTASTYKNIQRLVDGEFDFIAQTGGGIPDSVSIRKTLNMTLPVVLIGHRDMPKLNSLHELNGKPFIMSKFPDFSRHTEKILKKYNLTPKIISYIDGHEAICAMVASGMGYAFLPRVIPDNSHVKDVVVISDIIEELPDLVPAMRIKKQKYIPPVKAAFWDFLDQI